MQLQEILKQERKQLNLTQEEVGNKLYVTRQTISNWETGKTLPDIDSLIDIAKFYDLSLDNLLLKGSDIVENIKRKEKLTRLNKWSYVPIMIILLVVFLMYRSKIEGNIVNLLVCALLLILCVTLLSYFESQMKEIQRIPTKWTKKRIIIFGLLFILGIVIGYLSAYFES